MSEKNLIDLWADIVCPWCYLAAPGAQSVEVYNQALDQVVALVDGAHEGHESDGGAASASEAETPALEPNSGFRTRGNYMAQEVA
ncbi:hypothetical protein [uncultured Corynebacterium sp.]|uniref:hypothetical protein n=1 Tax=uncultured Corynebacterium sp. TaxID=159447 RepID=UPI0025D2775B|nr:hypothetical protein [uncultured Corynebacterium sp.]